MPHWSDGLSQDARELVAQLKYRHLAKELQPDIGDPPNKPRLSALLFKLTGLQPSEFRKMKGHELIPFLEQALAASKTPKKTTKPPKKTLDSKPRSPADWRKVLKDHDQPDSDTSWRRFRDKYAGKQLPKSRLWKFPLAELKRAGITLPEMGKPASKPANNPP